MTTLVVDPNGTTAFKTIQAAINAAQFSDEILVRNGTYNETIIINKSNITIIAENAEPLIDTTDLVGPCVRISGGVENINILGFQFRNHKAGLKNAAGIVTDGETTSNILIQGCKFYDIGNTPILATSVGNWHKGWTIANNLFSNVGCFPDQQPGWAIAITNGIGCNIIENRIDLVNQESMLFSAINVTFRTPHTDLTEANIDISNNHIYLDKNVIYDAICFQVDNEQVDNLIKVGNINICSNQVVGFASGLNGNIGIRFKIGNDVSFTNTRCVSNNLGQSELSITNGLPIVNEDNTTIPENSIVISGANKKVIDPVEPTQIYYNLKFNEVQIEKLPDNTLKVNRNEFTDYFKGNIRLFFLDSNIHLRDIPFIREVGYNHMYKTVGDAISHSGEGDIIEINIDNYYESIYLNKNNITIRGVSKISEDGERHLPYLVVQDRPAIHIAPGTKNIVVENLRFFSYRDAKSPMQCGIYAYGENISEIVIRNNIFDGIKSIPIFVGSSSDLVGKVEISGNQFLNFGLGSGSNISTSGIVAQNINELCIQENVFLLNSDCPPIGSLIHLMNDGSLVPETLRISANTLHIENDVEMGLIALSGYDQYYKNLVMHDNIFETLGEIDSSCPYVCSETIGDEILKSLQSSEIERYVQRPLFRFRYNVVSGQLIGCFLMQDIPANECQIEFDGDKYIIYYRHGNNIQTGHYYGLVGVQCTDKMVLPLDSKVLIINESSDTVNHGEPIFVTLNRTMLMKLSEDLVEKNVNVWQQISVVYQDVVTGHQEYVTFNAKRISLTTVFRINNPGIYKVSSVFVQCLDGSVIKISKDMVYQNFNNLTVV